VSTRPPRFQWIDLTEAATRLASTPEQVRRLVDEWILTAHTFDGTDLVVRP